MCYNTRMTKHLAQTYRILDEIEHIRLRTQMYAGSTSLQTSLEWIYDVELKKMIQKEITFIPAFIKIFSEILDNAIDEGRRAPDILDTIRVQIEDNTISITDNGRGIPVEIHPESKQYVAETVFSTLRAGSNFNDEDDQQLIGTNGVGAVITGILSSNFKIESSDGKKLFKQEFFNGMRERIEPRIKECDKSYTKITFTPDYKFFNLTELDNDHKSRIIKKIVDAAATNTKIKFYINGERILIHDFNDYIALYTDDYVYDNTKDWKVGISKSDGYEQISFVNSVETYQGGTHVNYVINQIVEELRKIIKKKHKVEVSPADIRGQMRIYVSANINRPRFSSQTKENMLSPVSEWKTSWSVPDKFIQKLLKSEIIQSVLDWVQAKAAAELAKELRKTNKDLGKQDPRRIENFSDATERVDRYKCVVFLSEGLSAAKSIQGGRGNNPYIASFPLRGKPLNIRDKGIGRVLGLDKRKDGKTSPSEIQKILTILGLQIGEKVQTKLAPDGEWIEIELDGKLMLVNENDEIVIDSKKVIVKNFL